MIDIFIIGAGGVGRETAWIIEEINKKNPTYRIVGFIDDNKDVVGEIINGYKVLGDTNYLINNFKKNRIVVAIANYKVKKLIVEKLQGNFIFETIIHPNVGISKTIEIGKGTIIYPGVIITTETKIGNHVIISAKCGIGHDSIINDYVSLLWNVNVSGHVTIEEGALIGSGATIIQNKKIGKRSIIGAGAVIIKNIKERTTNVGVPSKEIKNEKDIICNNSK